MSDDPLRGPRLRIERAYGHLNDIQIEAKRYLGSYHHAILADQNADKSKNTVKLIRIMDVPEVISLMVSDCIHNFRSALDLLAICMAERNQITSTAGIEFPIKRSKEVFDASIDKAEIRNAFGVDGINVLKDLQPYKGGYNPCFWAMHHLDRRNKHIRLNTIGQLPHIGKVTATIPAGAGDPVTFNVPRVFKTDGKETLLFESPSTAPNLDINAKVTYAITLDEAEGLENDPLDHALRGMAECAAHTLAVFERRFFRT